MSLAALAWRRLRAAVAIDPADTLWRAGRFECLRPLLEARLAADPADRGASVRLGHLALLRNDLAETIDRLEPTLDRRAGDPRAIALLAEAYYRRDDFGRAAPLFHRAGQPAFARAIANLTQPNRLAGDRAALLPFLQTDPLPVVALRVNGRPGRFLIDTGGAELILGEEMARQVGAARFGTERGCFGGGRTARYDVGTVASVELGGAVVEEVPVHVMEHVRAIGAAIGEPSLDGILGTVLLYHFRPTLDYTAGVLRLDPRSPTPAALDGVSTPFWLAGHHLVVAQGRVGTSVPMLLLVDTGLAGAGFTGPEATLAAAAIKTDATQAVQGMGAGGRVQVVPFRTSALSLGAVVRKDVEGLAGAFPPSLEWELGFRVGGLVSHGFFRTSAVTFDFDTMRLTVR